MPRVMHLLSQIPGYTGSGVFLANLIRLFKDKGIDQRVVVGVPTSLSLERVSEMTGMLPECLSLIRFGEGGDFQGMLPGMSDVMPYASRTFNSLSVAEAEAYQVLFADKAEEVLKTFKPDVLICHHLWLATAACAERARSYSNLKVAAVCHGTDLRQCQLAPHLGTKTHLRGLSRLDRIFTLHEGQIAELSTLHGLQKSSMKVIGNGFDDRYFHLKGRKPRGPFEPIRLVYAGKLAWSKGVRELILAVEKMIASDFPDVELILAGSGAGPESEAILAQVKESKAHIKYVGMLTQEELSDLFRASDIFVLPSYYEGVPLVIIEALACGMRVVASRLPGTVHLTEGALTESGRVMLVELPQMASVDAPRSEEIEAYIDRMALSIRLSADAIGEFESCSESDLDVISQWQWRRIADVIAAELDIY